MANSNALASRPDRLHDLLGEIAAAQRELERALSAADEKRPIDVARYTDARERLDAAITAWNRWAEPTSLAPAR